MTSPITYSYASGDLLEHPQTYQYSKYNGALFLESWLQNRNQIKKELGEPTPPTEVSIDVSIHISPPYVLDDLLEAVMAGIWNDIDLEWGDPAFVLLMLVKKFEIHKRLYNEYDKDFQPINKDNYHELKYYIRFAEIVEKQYSIRKELPYLNVLLKLIDTLIASRSRLNPSEKSRLAWLIDREYNHVLTCAQNNGVSL